MYNFAFAGWVSKLVDKKDVTDAFVDVRLGKAKLVKTSVILNDLDPKWDEEFRVELCHFADNLVFEIRDKDHAYSEFIGSVEIPGTTLLNNPVSEGWFDIKKKNGKTKGQLHIKVEFISRANMMKTYEVPCYFPMTSGNMVTLYQDAHVPPDLPQFKAVELPNGQVCQNIYSAFLRSRDKPKLLYFQKLY